MINFRTSLGKFRLALQSAYARAGYMPLREMDRRARLGRLPRTTVSRMLKGGTMLSRHQLRAFLEVCGVPAREHGDWLDAWQRAWNAQFHYPTTRLDQAAWPGYRVVEYERRVLHGGYPDYDLVRRLHARRYDASGSSSWEEQDVPLQHGT